MRRQDENIKRSQYVGYIAAQTQHVYMAAQAICCDTGFQVFGLRAIAGKDKMGIGEAFEYLGGGIEDFSMALFGTQDGDRADQQTVCRQAKFFAQIALNC